MKYRDKLEFLWFYRAAWLEEVTVYAVVVFLFVVSALVGVLLSSCSIVHYEALPDGRTEASAYVLGTDNVFEGAKFSADGPKRELSIDRGGANQIDGIRATNELVGTAVGAAVKAAVKP